MTHQRASSAGLSSTLNLSEIPKSHINPQGKRTRRVSSDEVLNQDHTLFHLDYSSIVPSHEETINKGIENPAFSSTPTNSPILGNYNQKDLIIPPYSFLNNNKNTPNYLRSISSSAVSSHDQNDHKNQKMTKTVKTQTEATYNVISSWKIVETIDPNSEKKYQNPQNEYKTKNLNNSKNELSDNVSQKSATSLKKHKSKSTSGGLFKLNFPSGYDCLVVKTHSVGIDTLSQTRNGYLYRFSEKDAFNMVIAWKMLTILLPCIFIFLTYTLDQIMDILVTTEVCSKENHQVWWCGLSITFIVGPSLIISVYSYEQ